MTEIGAQPAFWQSCFIDEIVQQTPSIKSFFLRLSKPFAHIAGQHVDVRLTAPGEGEPLAPTVPHQEVTPPPEPTVEATTVPTSEPPVMETPVVTAPPTPIPTLAVATPTPAPTAELLSTPALTPTPVTALVSERRPVDWPLVSVVLLQGIALLLGLAAFLRRK